MFQILQKTVEINYEDENDSVDSTELPINQKVINELDSLREKAHILLHQTSLLGHTDSPKSRVKLHVNQTAFLSRLVKAHNKRVMVKDKVMSRKRQLLLKVFGFLGFSGGFFIAITLKGRKKVVPKYNGFVDSLVYTQRVFNKKYGFKLRYTPAHAPIFLDRYAKLKKVFIYL